MNYHTSVLLQETIAGLQVSTGKRYIDATFGGGGHTKAIAELGAHVLALDRDRDALAEGQILNNDLMTLRQGNFGAIEQIAGEEGFTEIDGVLFDLGVSSHQIDQKERGFSFRFEESPLDMRFSTEETIPTAQEVLNHENEQTLSEIFSKFGEERAYQELSSRIVRTRVKHPIETVADLLTIIKDVSEGKDVEGMTRRVFQALRMYVNNELEELEKGLAGASHIVKKGGRIAVISFHSLEDRMVKRFFEKPEIRIVTKKPIRPTEAEIRLNRRAKSAKLRVGEVL